LLVPGTVRGVRAIAVPVMAGRPASQGRVVTFMTAGQASALATRLACRSRSSLTRRTGHRHLLSLVAGSRRPSRLGRSRWISWTGRAVPVDTTAEG